MVNEKKNDEVELKKYLVLSTVYTKDKLGGQHVQMLQSSWQKISSFGILNIY